ncbi:hypothetical protein [Qiania dongpingensis]|uniref:SCP2 domain-containing protein n=1 Tax=Qiania dongpingensis TaxID=2763669 RepID=A0A7G9G5M9_9FIRM|nr:hypothetical protein [Qiania dongpingensis]QNM06111.1 hypothetical protein H9Q78_02825 [Qiania dongpingensis]
MSQLVLEALDTGKADVWRMSARKKRSLAVKKGISAVILHFLFYGLEMLNQKEEKVRTEIGDWEEGFTFGIGMGEKAPALYMRKEERRLVRLPAAETSSEDMDLMIRFKSVDAAFAVMSGQIGVAGSYARHGFMLKGDIARAMSVVRCMDLAEAYLFPRFLSRRILKEVPKKNMGIFRTYLAMAGRMIRLGSGK